jgi:outer membrane protein OmpA-like peptidoglycan-associated protein
MTICVIAASITAVSLAPRRALADDPVMLGLEGDFMIPVTSPQFDRFEPGGGGSLSVMFGAYALILPVLRLRGGVFADGARPTDARLADPGIASLFTLTGGIRLRPAGLSSPHDVRRGTGFWIEIDIGAALTGTLVRPTFEGGLGATFEAGEVGVGPAFRFIHVMQTEQGIDASSAYVATAGLEIVLLDARPAAIAAPVIEPEPVPPLPEAEVAPTLPDRDGDGILDEDDECDREPEDVDGFRDDDGCPDVDDDGDTIPDRSDPCPREGEDIDRWQDTDGCPDPDNDGDGAPDASDACPDQPETVNGNDDGDGCPDEGLIELVGDRIVLEEAVLFAPDRAHVRSSALPHLEAIVSLWRQHLDWAGVRIEGHGDAQGDQARSLELSERRAQRVLAALVELGMPASLLTAEGHGASHPRVDGTSAEAYAANRRIELVVTASTADGSAAVDVQEAP